MSGKVLSLRMLSFFFVKAEVVSHGAVTFVTVHEFQPLSAEPGSLIIAAKTAECSRLLYLPGGTVGGGNKAGIKTGEAVNTFHETAVVAVVLGQSEVAGQTAHGRERVAVFGIERAQRAYVATHGKFDDVEAEAVG